MKINYVHENINIIPYSSCIFIIDLLTDMIDKLHYHKRHWKYWLSALTYIWICYQPSDMALILKEKGLFHGRRRAWILWGMAPMSQKNWSISVLGCPLSSGKMMEETLLFIEDENQFVGISSNILNLFFPRTIYLRKGIIAKLFFRNTLVCAILDIL